MCSRSTKKMYCVDLNRPRNDDNKEAIDEYRDTIREIIEELGVLDKNGNITKPYLHLAIHGMRDEHAIDIEIGTRRNETCCSDIKKWFVEEIKRYGYDIKVDQHFIGDSSKSVHSRGDLESDSDYTGYGENFNTIQIEISRRIREKHRERIVNNLADIISKFNYTFT